MTMTLTESEGRAAPDDELRELAGADPEAFARVYRRLFGGVLRSAVLVLHDDALSEEVAQEVMLDLWLGVTRFDPERAGATTWLSLIARRRAIDRVRATESSRTRDVRIGIRDWFDRAGLSEDVAETVEAQSEFERVRNALPLLPCSQRRAVELAFLEGYTRAEVAEILGIPLSTANWHVRSGILALRDLLA